MSIFSSECVCALGESAVKNCSIHGGKHVTGHIKYKGKLYAPVVGCATVSGEIEDVDAKLGKAVEALRGLMNDIGGGRKSCRHNFSCVCAGDKARETLKEIEGASLEPKEGA